MNFGPGELFIASPQKALQPEMMFNLIQNKRNRNQNCTELQFSSEKTVWVLNVTITFPGEGEVKQAQDTLLVGKWNFYGEQLWDIEAKHSLLHACNLSDAGDRGRMVPGAEWLLT